jgi:hypothetical protein
MGLSNQQIERYARQIIVPGMGGAAQQRLLSARLMIAGKATNVSSVLAYMVGAGIGEVRLRLPVGDAAALDSMILRATRLNPDVVVMSGAEDIEGLNLILAIVGNSTISEPILSPDLACANVPMILVRLDQPARIAVLPARPPCPFCADDDLIAPSTRSSYNAGFVAMVAATEAFKLLASSSPPRSPTLLQFAGFAYATRALGQRPLTAQCACSIRVAR